MKNKRFLKDLVRKSYSRRGQEEIESLILKDKDGILTLLDLLKDKDSEIRKGVLSVFFSFIWGMEEDFFHEMKEELKNRFVPLLKDRNQRVRIHAIDSIFAVDDMNNSFELSEDKSKFLEEIISQLVKTSYKLLKYFDRKGLQRDAYFLLIHAANWFLEAKEDYETALGILLKLAGNSDELIRGKTIEFAERYARNESGRRDQKLLEKIILLIKETAGQFPDKKEKGLDSKMVAVVKIEKEIKEKKRKKKIEHFDEIGIPRGYSIEKGAKIEHFDEIGIPNGYSMEKGGKTKHFDKIGIPNGYSIKKGDKIEHFDEIGIPNGYSIEKGGKIKHFDKYGIPKGKDERKKI